MPLTGSIAAVSCGIVDGEALLDLDYSEDSRAEVDANVVMSGDGGLVEVQATAERMPVSRASFDDLLALAEPAIARFAMRRRRSRRPAWTDVRSRIVRAPGERYVAVVSGMRRIAIGWVACIVIGLAVAAPSASASEFSPARKVVSG